MSYTTTGYVLNNIIITVTYSIITYFISYYIFPVAANSTFINHHSETQRNNILIPVRAKSSFLKQTRRLLLPSTTS